jgi:hypothetical protein
MRASWEEWLAATEMWIGQTTTLQERELLRAFYDQNMTARGAAFRYFRYAQIETR